MIENNHAIILVGPPCSGKGEQAELLKRSFGYLHVDSGELLRGKLDDLALKATMAAGKLAADEFVVETVDDFLPAILPNRIVFDGVPRTEVQAIWLAGKMQANSFRVCLIELVVGSPEDVILPRMRKRRKKSGREDDTENVFKQRMEVYNEYKEEMVSFFSTRSHLVSSCHKVNASLSIHSVGSKIATIVTRELQAMMYPTERRVSELVRAVI